jgi:hypothetical protein
MSNEINNNSTKFNYRLKFKQRFIDRFAKFITSLFRNLLELNKIIVVLHNIR